MCAPRGLIRGEMGGRKIINGLGRGRGATEETNRGDEGKIEMTWSITVQAAQGRYLAGGGGSRPLTQRDARGTREVPAAFDRSSGFHRGCLPPRRGTGQARSLLPAGPPLESCQRAQDWRRGPRASTNDASGAVITRPAICASADNTLEDAGAAYSFPTRPASAPPKADWPPAAAGLACRPAAMMKASVSRAPAAPNHTGRFGGLARGHSRQVAVKLAPGRPARRHSNGGASRDSSTPFPRSLCGLRSDPDSRGRVGR